MDANTNLELHSWWLSGDLDEYEITLCLGVIRLPAIHGGPMLVCLCTACTTVVSSVTASA